jgi:MFS transporter, DHA1 family, inner membrane transport protein
MSWKERIILILLASLNFTHILDFMIMMPLGSYLMPFFKITPKAFSVLVAAYTLSAFVSGFVAAFFVDDFDRKKVLIFAYIGFLLGTIGCGLSPTFEILFAMRVIAGLFGGLIGAQVISIVSDTFSYERRGAAMGAIMSAFAIASTFGVPFALYLAKYFSWHAPFLFLGIVGSILLPLLLIYLPNMAGHIQADPQHKHRKIDALKNIFQEKKQYLSLFLSGAIMFGHFIIIPFINPYMEFNVGFSKTTTPLIYLVGGISAFFASNILGSLSDKYGKLHIFTICVYLALPLVWAITNMPATTYHIPVLAIFGVWFSVATGRGVTLGAMVSNVVTPEHRGSFQSFNSSLQQLGSGLAALVCGSIITKDETTQQLANFAIVGYISIATLLACVFVANYIFKGVDEARGLD